MADMDSVKRYLEVDNNVEDDDDDNKKDGVGIQSLPPKFLVYLIMQGLRSHHLKTHSFLCSFTVPPRLVNADNVMHGGTITMLVDMVSSFLVHNTPTSVPGVRVSVETNLSFFQHAYLHDDIEIEAEMLHGGKSIDVASIELREMKTRRIIARGRHTLRIVPSKM